MKAVIDLGTNTFNLLIAEVKNGQLHEAFKLEYPVKIGQGGINKGVIEEQAFQRGLSTLGQFKSSLDQFNIGDNVKAFATSAIRNAKNGTEFIEKAASLYQLEIDAISGEEEAGYIYNGVSHSFNFPEEEVLVMDIGGGSVELIIGRKDKMVWKRSYETGAVRLMDTFQKGDPIGKTEIQDIESHLESTFQDLFEILKMYPLNTLVGSAGSFETLVDMVLKDLQVIPNSLSRQAYEIRREDFDVFYEVITTSNHEQRMRLKGMKDFRVDMIVVSAILMNFIIQRAGIERIIASEYSLKEGVFFS